MKTGDCGPPVSERPATDRPARPRPVPSIGRMVLCFCPERWEGARPGQIVRVFGADADSAVNVQVTVDGGDAPGDNNWTSQLVLPGDFVVPTPPDLSRWVTWPPFVPPQGAQGVPPLPSPVLAEKMQTLGQELSSLRSLVDDTRTGLANQEAAHSALYDRVGKLEKTAVTVDEDGPTEGQVIADGHTVEVSVDSIAAAVHEHWLKSADRSYSPFNKPWGELENAQRAQISRQVVIPIQLLQEAIGGGKVDRIEVTDEYQEYFGADHLTAKPEMKTAGNEPEVKAPTAEEAPQPKTRPGGLRLTDPHNAPATPPQTEEAPAGVPSDTGS